MEAKISNEKIGSLQLLRCFGFLGIFLCHTGLSGFKSLGGSGVSLFIVLSGFLMVYNYLGKNKLKHPSLKNNLLFAINKMRRLYPLHIVTMAAMLVFMFIGDETQTTGTIVLKVILNVFLIQEWLPLADREINGMSWFLCEIIFFYFLFPYILNKMQRKYNRSLAKFMIFLSILLIWTIDISASRLSVWIGGLDDPIWAIDLDKWLIYYFPPVRMIEFFIGCNLGYIYMHRPSNLAPPLVSNILTYTFMEIIAVIIVFLSNIAYLKHAMPNLYSVFDIVRVEKWWMYTLVFIFGSVILVYIFALGKGYLTQTLLNKKIFLSIAKLSPYTYLIHTVIFRYLSIIYYHLPGVDGECFYHTYGRWINLTIGFLLTEVSALAWIKIENFMRSIHK